MRFTETIQSLQKLKPHRKAGESPRADGGCNTLSVRVLACAAALTALDPCPAFAEPGYRLFSDRVGALILAAAGFILLVVPAGLGWLVARRMSRPEWRMSHFLGAWLVASVAISIGLTVACFVLIFGVRVG